MEPEKRYAAGGAAFAGVLATRIVQLKPYDPGSKGARAKQPTWAAVAGRNRRRQASTRTNSIVAAPRSAAKGC
jgi:hypothetical protein